MDRMQTSIMELLGQRDIAVLLPHLVPLVARGEPVPVDQLAAEVGLPVDEVESRLEAEPGIDWDTRGRLLGFGLTQRPTQHRFTVGDQQLYAFCAADTLMLPVMLGRAATAESTCPATGQQIRVRLTPRAVQSVDPTTAVVSQICPCSSIVDIRATACEYGHFYSHRQCHGSVASRASRWRGAADRQAVHAFPRARP